MMVNNDLLQCCHQLFEFFKASSMSQRKHLWTFISIISAEQAPFLQTYAGTDYFDNFTSQYVKNMSLQRGTWRADIENDFLGYDPPNVTVYTGISARYYGVIFLVIFLIHMAALFLLKSFFSQDFTELNVLEKVLHCAESTSFPYAVRDWDFKKGGPQEHYARMKDVRFEVSWNISINLIFNCSLLVPLVYLCKFVINMRCT